MRSGWDNTPDTPVVLEPFVRYEGPFTRLSSAVKIMRDNNREVTDNSAEWFRAHHQNRSATIEFADTDWKEHVDDVL